MLWSSLPAAAGATPLTAGSVPVRFVLKHGFRVKPSTRVLPLVFRESFGGCEAPPQFAGYVLFWQPRRLVLTLLVRFTPSPSPRLPCPGAAYVRYVDERVVLPRAIGPHKLLDGATKPPTPVRAG